jgi:hypothetical protein
MNSLTSTYCAICTTLYDLFKAVTSKNPYNAKVYGELSKLTDRDLQDIGVTRGDIENIARGKSIPSRGVDL